MIKSDKFPVDCLFFIFEQDFELYRDASLDPSESIIGVNTASLDSMGQPASSSADVPEPRGQKRKPGSDRKEVAGRSAAADMVMMVNAAARKGIGDLVWLGYNPKSNNGKVWTAPRVKYGTQLVCINAIAAERIHFVMGTGAWKAQHIDMWLLKWCHDHRFSKGRCSYVFPPLGCFGSHASECCPETGNRKTLWDEVYTAEGTRPSEDKKGHRSKDVYGMSEGGKGYVDLKCALKEEYFLGNTGFWRTCIDLPKQSTAGESELTRRRRRREMSNLKYRVQQDDPDTVLRLTKVGAQFIF